jgi:predicted RNase H-like HicB family nuclease
MKVREIIKQIEEVGWYRIKAKGGHRQYKHSVRRGRVTVPGQREERMATYLIVIGRTLTGYSAHCPDVLGCAAVGKTVEEVLANMKKALELHFEGMMEDGEALPRPGGVASYREVMKDLDVDHYFLGHVQIDTSRFAVTVS